MSRYWDRVVVDEKFALLRFDDVSDEFGEIGETSHLVVVMVVVVRMGVDSNDEWGETGQHGLW